MDGGFKSRFDWYFPKLFRRLPLLICLSGDGLTTALVRRSVIFLCFLLSPSFSFDFCAFFAANFVLDDAFNRSGLFMLVLTLFLWWLPRAEWCPSAACFGLIFELG